MKAGVPLFWRVRLFGIACVVVGLTVSGCLYGYREVSTPTVWIKAHRDAEFHARVSRLLVIVPRSDHPDEDSMFRRFLEQALHDKRVAALAVIATNATDVATTMQSLTGQRAAIAILAPQAVLDLKTTIVVPVEERPQWRIRIHYDASLYSVPLAPMASRIWRGELIHAGPEDGMEGRFMLAAQQLVDRLDADGLLTAHAGPRR